MRTKREPRSSRFHPLDLSNDWQLDLDWAQRYQVARAMIDPADGPAQRSEGEVVQWAALRPGVWYPRLRTWRSLSQRPDGSWGPREWEKCSNCRSETHIAIFAEPLNVVDPSEFAIPEAWLKVPVKK